MKYKNRYAVKLMCKVLKISESGYYRWLKNKDKPSKRHLLLVKINEILSEHPDNANYGYDRILKKLFEHEATVSIRIPIIPTVNDTVEEMRKIKEFLAPYKPINIELLPYHKMGEHKYMALGMNITSFNIPSKEKVEELNGIFQHK